VPLFLIVCAAVGVAALNAMPLDRIANQTHANEKHASAPVIRRFHRDGLCRDVKALVSRRRGTLLVACKMDDKPKRQAAWGLLIWRVLEKRNGSVALLDPQDVYECTVFAADWGYVEKIADPDGLTGGRDGYVKVADTEWFGPLRWLVYPR
jgi:hypothetical protein